MKSIKFVLLAISLFGSTCLTAQKLAGEVKWGVEFEAPSNSSLDDIVAYDQTGIYALKVKRGGFISRSNTYQLQHFDADLKPDKSFDMNIQEAGEDCNVNSFLPLNGKLFVFYTLMNKKAKKNILFVDEIDKTSLKIKNQKRKIGEIDYSGNSKRNSGGFSYRVSRDSSKVLIYYALPDTKGDPESFGFNVLDENLTSLWEKMVTLPYKDGLFDIESVRVDNEGNAYMLALSYKDKRKSKRKGVANYTYEVFAYSNNGNAMKQYTMALPGKFITDMQFEILNGSLLCAGFYSNSGTYSVRGTYFQTIDVATKEIKTKSTKEFGIDFIAQNLSERQAKKAKKKEAKGEDQELYAYDLDRILIGRDGSAVLVGEQYYVRVTTTYSRYGSYSTYHYYYNDIIAVKMDPDGQILWAEKIAKAQHSTNDGGFYSSYALAIVQGKLCFIFNDNPENLDYDGKGRPDNVNVRKSVAVLVSLDRDGKQEKQPLFVTRDVDVFLRPKVCEQIANNQMILFGQRRKNQQFARLFFN